MKVIPKEIILMMHSEIIRRTGGTDGIRDENLLDSAIETPFQTFDGKALYPGLHARAARIAFGIVRNHPMIDGNKRLGAHVMLTFLAVNGCELKFTQKELSDTFLSLADGKLSYEDLLSWIINHESET